MEKTNQQKFWEFLILNVGTILSSLGVYFFTMPNNFSTGGVTGIAIIVSHLVPGISTGTLISVLNMVLLAVGFLVLGRKFGVSTAYSSILLSAIIWGLERVWPMAAPFTDEPLLELFFATGIGAMGSALLFNIGASTGGMDVVAMVLRKFTSVNIGRATLLVNLLIAVSACFVFDIRTGLFSILGRFLSSMVVDSVIDSFHQSKYMHIVCSEPEPICDFISNTLGRGATILEGTGAYTHQHKYVILTVMSRGQAVALRRYVRTVEPHAFIMITSTSEIIGKGFQVEN